VCVLVCLLLVFTLHALGMYSIIAYALGMCYLFIATVVMSISHCVASFVAVGPLKISCLVTELVVVFLVVFSVYCLLSLSTSFEWSPLMPLTCVVCWVAVAVVSPY